MDEMIITGEKVRYDPSIRVRSLRKAAEAEAKLRFLRDRKVRPGAERPAAAEHAIMMDAYLRWAAREGLNPTNAATGLAYERHNDTYVGRHRLNGPDPLPYTFTLNTIYEGIGRGREGLDPEQTLAFFRNRNNDERLRR